jgi:hypothetical protein
MAPQPICPGDVVLLVSGWVLRPSFPGLNWWISLLPTRLCPAIVVANGFIRLAGVVALVPATRVAPLPCLRTLWVLPGPCTFIGTSSPLKRQRAAGDPMLAAFDGTPGNTLEAKFWSHHCFCRGLHSQVSRGGQFGCHRFHKALKSQVYEHGH